MVIDHGPIKDLVSIAGTLRFRVADPEAQRKVVPGDWVEFWVRNESGIGLLITRIEPLSSPESQRHVDSVRPSPNHPLFPGPVVPIRHVFPAPGVYMAYGQLMHEGRMVTTRFAIAIGEPRVAETRVLDMDEDEPISRSRLTSQELHGMRIYNSSTSRSDHPIHIRIGDGQTFPANTITCASCHSSDGRGRREGGAVAVDIRYDTITKPYLRTTESGRTRSPYSDALLARAIVEGVDSDGHVLDFTMPRWQMSDRDLADLIAYLHRLGSVNAPGVTADTIRIGTILDLSGPLAKTGAAVRYVFERVFENVNQGRKVYGRSIELIVADGRNGQHRSLEAATRLVEQEQVLAFIGNLGDAATRQVIPYLEAEGIPLIAPLAPALQHEDLGANQVFSTRYRWYMDIEMMAFWHLHLQGIFGFNMGLTGGTVIEPKGSQFVDRMTGEPIYRTAVDFPEPTEYATTTTNHNLLADDPQVFGTIGKRGDEHEFGVGIMTRSFSTPVNAVRPEITNAGTEIVDIITSADSGESSFREVAFWMSDDANALLHDTGELSTHMDGHSTMNQRAERLEARLTTGGMQPQEVFLSTNGDPATPLIMAHPGDRVVFRLFSQGTNDAHSFRFAGPRFGWERNNVESRPVDATQEGIGSFHHYELMGGAGGPSNVPGDYMWYMPIGALDFADGAWGILRVGSNPGLQDIGSAGNAGTTDVCANATGTQTYNVAAIESPRRTLQAAKIFVLADANGNPNLDEVAKGQPLVMRANSGDCITVRLFNRLEDDPTHVGMTPGLLTLDPNTSYGFNFGNNTGGQTAAPGGMVEYTWYAEPQMKPAADSMVNADLGIGAIEWNNLGTEEQKIELGVSYIASFANVPEDLNDGLFAALVVEPRGSFWFDSVTGNTLKPTKRTSVSAVIVPPDGNAFREHVLFMHENSVRFISSIRALGADVFGGAAFNYRRAPGGMDTKSDPRRLSTVHTMTSQAGDPTKIRIVYTNGSEDVAFRIDGHRGPLEAGTSQSNALNVWPLNVGWKADIELDGGASEFPADYLFGATQHRRIMDGGQWGIFRVLGDEEAATLGVRDPETGLRSFTSIERSINKAARKRAKGQTPDS